LQGHGDKKCSQGEGKVCTNRKWSWCRSTRVPNVGMGKRGERKQGRGGPQRPKEKHEGVWGTQTLEYRAREEGQRWGNNEACGALNGKSSTEAKVHGCKKGTMNDWGGVGTKRKEGWGTKIFALSWGGCPRTQGGPSTQLQVGGAMLNKSQKGKKKRQKNRKKDCKNPRTSKQGVVVLGSSEESAMGHENKMGKVPTL